MSREERIVFCESCGEPLNRKVKCCPNCGKKNKKPFYTRWWFILLVVIVILRIVSGFGSGKKAQEEAKEFDWSTLVLSDVIPAPESNKGEIHSNDEEKAWISVSEVSDEAYRTYLDLCKEYGFTVEGESNSLGYEAFNDDGYQLKLSHYSNGSDLDIRLYAPMELGTLQWPKSELAALIPVPDSDVGKVTSDSSDAFYLYVGQVSKENYSAYTDACYEAGFSVDYNRGDNYFRAYNSDGVYLAVSYEGNSIISIKMEAPDAPEEIEEIEEIEEAGAVETQAEVTQTTENGGTTVPGEELVDGMRPSFKEAMDTYEKFFDDYCNFMVKYNDSDDTIGMLGDYLNFMTSYVDTMAAMDKLGEDDLNDAELLYYTEATLRIAQKLATVSQSLD